MSRSAVLRPGQKKYLRIQFRVRIMGTDLFLKPWRGRKEVPPNFLVGNQPKGASYHG
jgi:hypothetical protein